MTMLSGRRRASTASKDRFGLHHHALSATVRNVVRGPMLIARPIAQIMYTDAVAAPASCARFIMLAVKAPFAQHWEHSVRMSMSMPRLS